MDTDEQNGRVCDRVLSGNTADAPTPSLVLEQSLNLNGLCVSLEARREVSFEEGWVVF